MRDFRSLKVWERSHLLALSIYGMTASFPEDEKYGLTSQLRRCGVSIPANIAEGCGRSGERELARFLNIAMGSASELEYLLLLSRDINLMDETLFTRTTHDVIEVKKMLTSYIQKLKADS